MLKKEKSIHKRKTGNFEKYHFSDFTYEKYRHLMKLAKKNYIFRLFTDFNKNERFILWRHDIDFSPEAALPLAEIEREEKVKATYFILLHSEFHNLLESSSLAVVKEILKMGHSIGLHFDAQVYGITKQSYLEKYLSLEKKFLELLIHRPIKVFSFHNPTPYTMNCPEFKYAGMINAYANYFQKEVGYCSDSNGYWRFRRLNDVLEKAEDKCLQVNLHPEWWQKNIMSPKEKVWKYIDEKAGCAKNFYTNLLKQAGREIIDWK